ncbi:MAG: xylulokinase, partial [Thermoleophilia bacterium]|nr:xylulokinase [Thermoleophilia bacterium]
MWANYPRPGNDVNRFVTTSSEGARVPALVAGVDSSTQGTKVVVVETGTGAVVAEGRAPHVVSGTGGARESDPRAWWAALGEALAATGCAAAIDAISVAAQQHGLVALGGDGEPLHPAILWNDTRSAPDARVLVEALGGPEAWAARLGSVPAPSFTVTSWAWLRRTRPEVAGRVRAIRLPHDYLTERLTGRAVTDRGDASGTGWWSPAEGRYVADVLGLPQIALEEGMLPHVQGPGEPAGPVTDAAARELGLRAGIPVGSGTGDNMGAALGLGLAPGVPVVSLGTSGTAYVVSDTPTADPTGTIAGFADASGGYLPLAATLNCTLAIDRIAGWLGLDREDVADDTDVVVLPYLGGERTPHLPAAGGTFVGLRDDTRPGEILLAAYRGAVASLLGAVDLLAD